ncbi:MAG: hypothetical protein II781_05215, partial [Clostridia bacterium]|nr:hypothetical protein [Clostridia bacterium]
GYPGQGMPVQGYPNAGMQGQNYPMQGGPVQSRPNQGMPPRGYVNPGSGQNGNPPAQTPGQSPVTGRTDSGNASQVFVQPSSSQPGDIVQKTYDIYGVQSTPNPSRPATAAPQGQDGNAAVSYTPQAEVRSEPVQAPVPVQTPASPVQAEPEIPAAEPVPELTQEENAPSLQQMVQQASANEEGKTMSYFSTVASAKAAQAGAESVQAAPAGSGPADPVVGWLVCVKGANFGRSYSICAGRNSIGRGQDNRICIAGDMSISRQKQAFLIYEPRHKDFFLAPGEASGLTYLNGEYLSEMKKLSASDKIDMGEATFLFVPLCGEEFSWEDYLE